MGNRENELYIGNVTYPDPTAWEAIGYSNKGLTYKQAPIVSIAEELRELNLKRRTGEISKQEFAQLRAPFVKVYRGLLKNNERR